MDLRAEIKAWERDFFAAHKRKPGSADIKAEPGVYEMYRRYRKERAGAAGGAGGGAAGEPSTPRKRPSTEAENEGTDEDVESDLAPIELFPTPQVGGRILGLFEIRMPTTPSKGEPAESAEAPAAGAAGAAGAASAGAAGAAAVPGTPARTPGRRTLATPSSRRTPTYLRQRRDSSSPFKQRSSRYRSISELAPDDDEMPTMSLSEIAQFSLVPPGAAATAATPAEGPDKPEGPEGPGAAPKKFKRKIKKVIRPVLPTDVPVTSQAKPNFQRLNIQKKPFRGGR